MKTMLGHKLWQARVIPSAAWCKNQVRVREVLSCERPGSALGRFRTKHEFNPGSFELRWCSYGSQIEDAQTWLLGHAVYLPSDVSRYPYYQLESFWRFPLIPSVQWRMCRTTESSVFRPPCPWEVFVIPLKLSSPWVQYAKLASGSAPAGSNHGFTDSLKQKKQGKPERGILNRTYYGTVGEEQKKKTRHIFSYGQHGFTKW